LVKQLILRLLLASLSLGISDLRFQISNFRRSNIVLRPPGASTQKGDVKNEGPDDSSLGGISSHLFPTTISSRSFSQPPRLPPSVRRQAGLFRVRKRQRQPAPEQSRGSSSTLRLPGEPIQPEQIQRFGRPRRYARAGETQ